MPPTVSRSIAPYSSVGHVGRFFCLHNRKSTVYNLYRVRLAVVHELDAAWAKIEILCLYLSVISLIYITHLSVSLNGKIFVM